MGAMFNSVTLLGNLTRDPEVRFTPTGTQVAKFGIALNRKVKGKDSAGNPTERDFVTFVEIEVWGKLAEICVKFLKKGRQVVLNGELRMDMWEDKTTHEKRSRLYVVAHTVQFLGSKPGSKDDEVPAELTAADFDPEKE